MKHTKPQTLTLILATGLLGVTACAGQSNDTTSLSSTSTPSASEENVNLTAPTGVAQNASWTVSIPAPNDGSDTQITTTPDGKTLAYTVKLNRQIRVGQINLENGQKMGEKTVDALDRARIAYDGGWLVLTQVEGRKWATSVFPAGQDSDPVTKNGEAAQTMNMGAGTGYGSAISGRGTLYGSSAIPYGNSASNAGAIIVDPATGEAKDQPGKTEKITGCVKDTSCSLPVTPEYAYGGAVVSSYAESDDKNLCSLVQKCLTGFKTDTWDSQALAPEGADARTGKIVTAGDGYVLGAWSASHGQGTVYKTIKVTDPKSPSATITDTDSNSFGQAGAVLHVSPNGEHLAAGPLVADLGTGKGKVSKQGGMGTYARFYSVTDAGKAYGTANDSVSTLRYVDHVITFTADGQASQAGDRAAVPLGATSTGGLVLANEGQAKGARLVISDYKTQ